MAWREPQGRRGTACRPLIAHGVMFAAQVTPRCGFLSKLLDGKESWETFLLWLTKN